MDNIDFGIPVRKLNNWLFNFYLNIIVKNLKTINFLVRTCIVAFVLIQSFNLSALHHPEKTIKSILMKAMNY